MVSKCPCLYANLISEGFRIVVNVGDLWIMFPQNWWMFRKVETFSSQCRHRDRTLVLRFRDSRKYSRTPCAGEKTPCGGEKTPCKGEKTLCGGEQTLYAGEQKHRPRNRRTKKHLSQDKKHRSLFTAVLFSVDRAHSAVQGSISASTSAWSPPSSTWRWLGEGEQGTFMVLAQALAKLRLLRVEIPQSNGTPQKHSPPEDLSLSSTNLGRGIRPCRKQARPSPNSHAEKLQGRGGRALDRQADPEREARCADRLREGSRINDEYRRLFKLYST